jgi:DNA-binding NtrC family response regulator
VVDDDRAVRQSLGAALEDAGYAVTLASTGAEGLAALRASRIAVAIVDIRLRDMRGDDMILAARKVLATDTRYLIYTGTLGYQLSEALIEAGVSRTDVMRKPAVDLGTITDAVRRLAPTEACDAAE